MEQGKWDSNPAEYIEQQEESQSAFPYSQEDESQAGIEQVEGKKDDGFGCQPFSRTHPREEFQRPEPQVDDPQRTGKEGEATYYFLFVSICIHDIRYKILWIECVSLDKKANRKVSFL